MWCGVDCVAEITGWSRQDVWLHIRWHREQSGRRLTDKPRGGTNHTEQVSALERAGFVVSPALWKYRRRVRYGDFAKGEGRRGVWLLKQYKHAFVHRGGEPLRGDPNAIICQAYRVTRRRNNGEVDTR